MKYMTATQALMGGILKILSWVYLKYCRLIWYSDCICQLQLPATNTAYLVGFRGHRKLITICGKFAAVSRGIWQTGPRNLETYLLRKTVVPIQNYAPCSLFYVEHMTCRHWSKTRNSRIELYYFTYQNIDVLKFHRPNRIHIHNTCSTIKNIAPERHQSDNGIH